MENERQERGFSKEEMKEREGKFEGESGVCGGEIKGRGLESEAVREVYEGENEGKRKESTGRKGGGL